MRVTVDQDKCVGSGQCVLAVPEVFDQRDEDGIVKLRTEEVSDTEGSDRQAAVQRAARNCPSMAIAFDDA
jgi:ferredoxin